MNKPAIIKLCAATCLTTLATTAQADPIFHTLTITAGDQPVSPGPINGSFFDMSGVNVILEPGTAGGLLLGQDQNFVLNPDEPHPTGHPDATSGAGSGYPSDGIVSEGTALLPFNFFGTPTYVGTNPLSYQSGNVKPAPSADVDMASCVADVCDMTAELSAWEVFWNGSAFEQGPRPDNTGPFTVATGTYNLSTHAYVLDWDSQIKDGPFNGVPASWHLEGVHGVENVASDDGAVTPTLAAAVITDETELSNAGKTMDSNADMSCNPACLDIVAPASGGMSTVIVPLPSGIVADTEIRINLNDSWETFDTTSGDSISTAAGAPGFCPPPGSSQYVDGVTEGDLCVQLKMADSGLNDEDSVADQVTGIVSFAQGVVIPADPAPDPDPLAPLLAAASDSGSMDLWALMLTVFSLGLVRLGRK